MELSNEFEVAMPVDDAWAVLTDIEKIAPCMPGAELREVEGEEFRGVVKVKVGPITASYKGVARFEELDVKAHKAVLKAEGRETRGQGNATALITATLSPSAKGTKVEVATDLAITGKVAQFGRGVLADVSGKLLDQFVHNLETTVLAVPDAPDSPPAAAAADDAKTADSNGSAPSQPAEEVAAAPARRSRSKAAPAAGSGSSAEPTSENKAPVGSENKAPVGSENKAPARSENKAAAKSESKAAAAGSDRPDEAAEAPVEPAPVAPKAPPYDAGPRQISSPAADPVDLFDVAGGSVMKRLAPYLTVAGILLIARIVVYSLRRRRK
jgi:carbon monoxide dehydrogenase subunit G